MATSRRELIQALGVGAAALPIGDATLSAQSAGPMPTDASASGDRTPSQSETEKFLAQFETAWRPLDPQLRFVLRLIYARLQGLPPPAQLSPTELRRINTSLSFYLNAGAPALPHVEERSISVPSGRTRVRLYDPGITAPAATVVLLHGGGWVFGSLDTYDGFARQIAQRSGLRCLSLEYALAPEHPFSRAARRLRRGGAMGFIRRVEPWNRPPTRRSYRGFGRSQPRSGGLYCIA